MRPLVRFLIAATASLLSWRSASAQEAGQRMSTHLSEDGDRDGEGRIDDAPLAPAGGPTRVVALSWNPFTLMVSRASLNVEIVPVSHHALELAPYYFHTKTNEDSFSNVFEGFGGEIGYRYYGGRNGPRGFYFGPSFLVGFFDAIPKNGASKKFQNYGAAVDLGYQAIVADRWVVGLGGGFQYTVPTETFPPQELPASVYAARGLRPRLLLSLGVAF